ncbi:MAG: hypothetical protein R3A12_05215 [Ignavibacteria bacterium]
MKRKTILFLSLIFITVVSAFIGFNKQTDLIANPNDLPSWSVTVHGDGGVGVLADAEVVIKQGSTYLFDSPQYTNTSGITYFDNGGSSFPDGTYTVSAIKTGYSYGIVTVVISGGAPVYPITNVTIGPPL